MGLTHRFLVFFISVPIWTVASALLTNLGCTFGGSPAMVFLFRAIARFGRSRLISFGFLLRANRLVCPFKFSLGGVLWISHLCCFLMVLPRCCHSFVVRWLGWQSHGQLEACILQELRLFVRDHRFIRSDRWDFFAAFCFIVLAQWWYTFGVKVSCFAISWGHFVAYLTLQRYRRWWVVGYSWIHPCFLIECLSFLGLYLWLWLFFVQAEQALLLLLLLLLVAIVWVRLRFGTDALVLFVQVLRRPWVARSEQFRVATSITGAYISPFANYQILVFWLLNATCIDRWSFLVLRWTSIGLLAVV